MKVLVEQKYIHRDIKPDNIFFDDVCYKVGKVVI